MKRQIRIAGLAGVLFVLGTTAGQSQNLVQTLSVNLTAYDQTSSKNVKITTKDLINALAQTNVPGARLVLVTPTGNAPGTLGNLNAFLRVMKADTILFDVPSPDAFNLYQDFAAIRTTGNRIAGRAIDRFSFDSGSFRAELQGFSTWNITDKTVDGVAVGGSGAFVSTVNGALTIDGVTGDGIPAHGTITAGAPRPEQ